MTHEAGINHLRERYRAEKRAGNDEAAARITKIATAEEIPYRVLVELRRCAVKELPQFAAEIYLSGICFDSTFWLLPRYDVCGRCVEFTPLTAAEAAKLLEARL